MLEDRLEDDFELEERFEVELLERMEDSNDDSVDDDIEETVDVQDPDIVVKVEDSIVLDVREGIGAYVKTTAGEAVVVGAGVGGQDVVNGCGEATTAGLKLWEEDDFADELDNDTETVMVNVLDDAWIIVAPHVHIDTHVQTEEHVHENVDACVQEIAVASESDGVIPGGKEPLRVAVYDCEEDTVESCNEVDVHFGVVDGHDEEDGIDDNDENMTSDDGKEDFGGGTEDTGNGGGTEAVACVALCADGGAGGCPRGDDPEVAFLMMSAAY